MSHGGGGLVLFRVFGGGGGGVVSLVGVCCVSCFLDPVSVVHVQFVLPWKMLLCGGVCVWNCGPGVLWVPFKISRSLAIIPRVILGCAYIGGFGGACVGVSSFAVLIWASSPSDTTSFSAAHVRFACARLR